MLVEMGERRADSNHGLQIAGVVLLAWVLLNAAFYYLSAQYFAERAPVYGAQTPDAIKAVRIAFAVFSGCIGASAICAAIAPRWIGHGIAAAAGIASLVAAWAAFEHGMPNVLGVSLGLLGLVLPALVWRSAMRSRAAWAFLVATSAVYATVLLFGAPKVRGLLGIGLWTALIIPGTLAIGTIALVMVRQDYRDV